MLDNPGLRYAGFALTAVSLIAAVWLAMQGMWREATIMGGFVLAAILFAVWKDRLPALFTFLFTLVAAINAGGYVVELWDSPYWFDEFVHVITPFVVIAASVWLLIRSDSIHPRTQPGRYFVKVILFGLGIGLLWEAFEWAIGIVGTAQDTLIDLTMDTIGAVLAAIFCRLAARSEKTTLDLS